MRPHRIEWTKERDIILIDMVKAGLKNDVIAERFNCTPRVIQYQKTRLNIAKKLKTGPQLKWTAEMVEELERLFDTCIGDREIAKHFGCTKNAIIGKRRRLSLYRGDPVYNRVQKRIQKSRKPKRPPPEPAEPHSPPKVVNHPEEAESSPVGAPGRHVVTYGHHSSCRYPFGSAKTNDLTWCGEPAQLGSSYCSDHHQLCHKPLKSFQPTTSL